MSASDPQPPAVSGLTPYRIITGSLIGPDNRSHGHYNNFEMNRKVEVDATVARLAADNALLKAATVSIANVCRQSRESLQRRMREQADLRAEVTRLREERDAAISDRETATAHFLTISEERDTLRLEVASLRATLAATEEKNG